MNWKELVGKRVLIRGPYDGIEEVKVIEVSPSGKYVKVSDPYGWSSKWIDGEKYLVLEVLGDC
ncbi:MAG: hypothetical protein NDF55_10555 [archaeon GB-1867-005]|nr:hypothetical protein [Candidatus Culexmicrobium cathedralense]